MWFLFVASSSEEQIPHSPGRAGPARQNGGIPGATIQLEKPTCLTCLKIRQELHVGLLGLACIFARLAGAVEEEAVEGHELGLEGIEFDLCQLAFGDFAPAVDVGFALDLFAAVEVAQDFAGVIA